MTWEPVQAADLRVGDVVKREKKGRVIGMVTRLDPCTIGGAGRRAAHGLVVWFGDHAEVPSLTTKVGSRWYRRVR
jgi:hypothetical protein